MSPTAKHVNLRGRHLDLAAVVQVARQRTPVELNPDAHARVQAARRVVDRLAGEQRPIYGLTTELGAGNMIRARAPES